MKNLIYGIVITVCLVVAVVVFMMSRGGGASGAKGLRADDEIVVKCHSCQVVYTMSQKDYYSQLEERAKTAPATRAYAKCEKCGKDAVSEAVKCAQCGTVFFKGEGGAGDFEDRCPKCKYSAIEASRKNRLGQQ